MDPTLVGNILCLFSIFFNWEHSLPHRTFFYLEYPFYHPTFSCGTWSLIALFSHHLLLTIFYFTFVFIFAIEIKRIVTFS